MNFIEKGVFSESTIKRLEDLEKKKRTLTENILIEQTKNKMQLTKKDIIDYISENIEKEAFLLIDLLVKRVNLYNDKIEIYYHYTNKNDPDRKICWGRCFYTTDLSFEINRNPLCFLPAEISVEIFCMI